MASCVFCGIVAKEIPAAIVYEDDLSIAFMDAGQVNPGHVLVAVKAHAENLFELDDAQAGALLREPMTIANGIHPTAVIAPLAKIAPSASVGPYAVIGEDAHIGERTQIGAHSVIGAAAWIGDDTCYGR